MKTDQLPKPPEPAHENLNEAFLVVSGDLRLSANQKCWAVQTNMDELITATFSNEDVKIIRTHPKYRYR